MSRFASVSARTVARAASATPVAYPTRSRDEAIETARSSLGSSSFDVLASITDRILQDPVIFDRLQQIGQEAAREAAAMQSITAPEDLHADIVPGRPNHNMSEYEPSDGSEYVTLESVLDFEPRTPVAQAPAGATFKVDAVDDAAATEGTAGAVGALSSLSQFLSMQASKLKDGVTSMSAYWVQMVSLLTQPVRRLFHAKSAAPAAAEDGKGEEVARSDWPMNVAIVSGALLATLIVMRCPPGVVREVARVAVLVLGRVRV